MISWVRISPTLKLKKNVIRKCKFRWEKLPHSEKSKNINLGDKKSQTNVRKT